MQISPTLNNIEALLCTSLPIPPKPFSPGEVCQYIISFPSYKSPGYDLITAEISWQLKQKKP